MPFTVYGKGANFLPLQFKRSSILDYLQNYQHFKILPRDLFLRKQNSPQKRSLSTPAKPIQDQDTGLRRTYFFAICSMLYPGLGSLDSISSLANLSRQLPTAISIVSPKILYRCLAYAIICVFPPETYKIVGSSLFVISLPISM